MNINDKLLNSIETLKHTTFIEIVPRLYRELTDHTLETLKHKNIDIVVNDKIKNIKFNSYKRDCYAYKDKKCKALTKIDCINCSFYNNKLKMSDIERDIATYVRTHS